MYYSKYIYFENIDILSVCVFQRADLHLPDRLGSVPTLGVPSDPG